MSSNRDSGRLSSHQPPDARSDEEPGRPLPGPPPDARSDDEPGRPSPDSAAYGLRRITDARTMRALAHPIRIVLLEELLLGGALTATEVGERIGESPTTCSFHLRQLAKYGFVEEAGGGKGRARPWRLTSVGMSFPSVHDDPEAEIAAQALFHLVRDRQFRRYQIWLDTKTSYPREWQHAADDSEYLFYLTASELKGLKDDVTALLMSRYHERLTDPAQRPPGSAPVEVLTFFFPIRQPTADDGGAGEDGAGGDGAGEDGTGGAR